MAVSRPEPTPLRVARVTQQQHWMIWPFVGLLGLIVAVGGAYSVDRPPRELKELRKTMELIFLTRLEDQLDAKTKGER